MNEFYKAEKEDLMNVLDKKQRSLSNHLEGNPIIVGSSLWITEICLKIINNLTEEQYTELMER